MAKKKNSVEDRVIKRRQKDLDGYTSKYQEELEKRLNIHYEDLRPIWESTGRYLEKRVEDLYKQYIEYDSAGLEAKANAVLRKMEHLASIQGEIGQDLKATAEKLQPYYTQSLADEYTRSYYKNSFFLEQAAQVAANVPLLTEGHILGVIANPWLNDGANYSSRLRSNSVYLADKMVKVIKKATAEGLGWNEAARMISDVAGEGYFNSVRLFRTEMNRASSLAASYTYMKNADVLDGKRWNATLDKDTAAKDAKNDGKLYDLDYDTPANPGIPGQRIPNHPNCRCKYSPVLSALGVRNKERIARVNGKRTYTKAANYEEWAAEVGLPDLDERLERDNLKRYLRPGESLADLNKKVVRWEAKGGTITVPVPAWAKAKGKIPKAEEVFKAGEPGQFVEAKTVKEATAWAKNNLSIEHIDYKDFDIRTANDVNKTLKLLQDKFPEVKDTKWVTTNQIRNKALYDRKVAKVKRDYMAAGFTEDAAERKAKQLVKKKRVASDVYASSTNHTWGPQEGICFNKKFASDYNMFKKSLEDDVASGWHPPGTDTPAAVLTHEFGHQLDNYLERQGQRSWIKDMYKDFIGDAYDLRIMADEEVTKRESYGKLLSVYGAKDDAEFFAEAVSEYIHSDSPRPTAAKVVKRLEEALAAIRGGK